MTTYYSDYYADARPPRSIRGSAPNWSSKKESGDAKYADKSFSIALSARGYYINKDDYSWRGPKGQLLSTEFVEAMDKNHSWETCSNVLRALDRGSKNVNLKWNSKSCKYTVFSVNSF